MRTRAVEASLATAPLPRCAGSVASQCHVAAPPPQPDAHCAHAVQPCRPQCHARAPAVPDRGHQAPPDGTSVRVCYKFCDPQAPAQPREPVPGQPACKRRPCASMQAAAHRPRPAPPAAPITRRRCGVPRSPLEAALWRMADAEEAWAAERAAARREAEELRKRNARLERELRQLQARPLRRPLWLLLHRLPSAHALQASRWRTQEPS